MIQNHILRKAKELYHQKILIKKLWKNYLRNLFKMNPILSIKTIVV